MLDVAGDDLVVIANTGDDLEIYGAHVSPDPDLVTLLAARPHRRARLGPARRHVRGHGRPARDRRRRVVQPRRPRPRLLRSSAAGCSTTGARLTEAQRGASAAALGLARARAADVRRAGAARACAPAARWHDFQEFMIRLGGARSTSTPSTASSCAGIEAARVTPEVAAALAAGRGDRHRPVEPGDQHRADPARAAACARRCAAAPRAGRRRQPDRRRRRASRARRSGFLRWAGRRAERRGRRRATTATCSTASSPTSASTALPTADDRHADGRRRGAAGASRAETLEFARSLRA